MPTRRIAVKVTAVLAGLLANGPVLAQDEFDGPATRLTLELVLPMNHGQAPAVNLLLGNRALAMPLAGPLAGTAQNQLERREALYPTDLSKWFWWGMGGVAIAAVVISQTQSSADPAPSGTGAGP